jgi:sulfur relay (sulfurtransferase) DsrF/TusC family protein
MATKRRAACVIIALLLHDEECYKKKRLWCKEWYLKRAKFSHMNLLRELRVLSKSDLQNFLRMNETHFVN